MLAEQTAQIPMVARMVALKQKENIVTFPQKYVVLHFFRFDAT